MKNRSNLRNYLLILLLFECVSRASAQQAMVDGPYVFYRNSKVYVKSTSMESGNMVAHTDSFAISGKAIHPIKVTIDGHPDWDFQVKLRDKVEPRKATFAGADQMLFLSDIEGEFEAFRTLLIANKVIDDKYNWIFGKGKLIVAGDLFDRGKQVTQYIWLLYKLEDEARANGGDVNVVLGNHENMNLKGDFRYVQPEYLANAKLMNEPYTALYAADTELGRWLRSKNIVEKIGDLLVMHAGISPEVLHKAFDIERINTANRPYIDAPTKQIPDSLKIFLGNSAPFWYRGYFIAPKASMGLVDSTLQQYQVKRIVVGHTIIDKNVALYYSGKVLALDVNEHTGHHAAAFYDKGEWFIVDYSGTRRKLVYVTGNDDIKKEQVD